MNEVLRILSLEKEKRIEILRSNSGELKDKILAEIKEIDMASAWIRLVQNNELENASSYHVHKLPPTHGYGYSAYHLMIDQESACKDDWVEYCPEGKQLQLVIDDVLLIRK